MPIYKFKTFEEADRAHWHFEPDEAYYQQVAALWRLAHQLSPMTCRRGVFKFRSIEEANAHRENEMLPNK